MRTEGDEVMRTTKARGPRSVATPEDKVGSGGSVYFPLRRRYAPRSSVLRFRALVLACTLFLVVSALAIGSPPASASPWRDIREATQVSSTATTTDPGHIVVEGDSKSLLDAPPTVILMGTVMPLSEGIAQGWREHALRDFAETVGWPPVVRIESSDRLSVRKSISGTDWESASVRSFDFQAAAEAGISAEREDARLSGYTVTLEPFYGMPAYMAVLRDADGQPVEQRYRWQMQSWVLGVDAHGPGMANVDLRALSRQLLAIALQNGLVLPSGSPPSATATETTQTPGPGTGSCGATFSDVPSDMWAASYIRDLACRGVVSGYADGTFRPQSPTTRGQLVKMVVLVEGLPLVNPNSPTFSDVGASHTFYKYVETAHLHNLVGGYADGNFRPDAAVSRAQVAKIVVLAEGWNMQMPASPSYLCDVTPSHWAYSYVQVAIAHGIFTGYGDGCFHPDDDATRSQLAKVLILSSR